MGLLGRECVVGQRLRGHKTRDGVAEQVRVLPVVEAKFEFVKVPIRVLHADLMERTDNRPLEQTERAVDAVGVHVEHQNDGSRMGS